MRRLVRRRRHDPCASSRCDGAFPQTPRPAFSSAVDCRRPRLPRLQRAGTAGVSGRVGQRSRMTPERRRGRQATSSITRRARRRRIVARMTHRVVRASVAVFLALSSGACSSSEMVSRRPQHRSRARRRPRPPRRLSATVKSRSPSKASLRASASSARVRVTASATASGSRCSTAAAGAGLQAGRWGKRVLSPEPRAG